MASAISSVFKKDLFDDKVAIVTGGATGIGLAITKELLFIGCNVVIASRNQERLQKAEDELKSLFPSQNGDKPRIYAVQCNIRKEQEVKNLMQKTLQMYGKIDFLINNGGGQFMSLLSKMTLKGWNAVIETNLTGTFLMCQEVYKSWMCDHGGSIINIILDVDNGRAMMGHSAAARAGVDNLTKTLAIEWAHNGIRVNAVVPGAIYSETAAANYPDNTLFKKFDKKYAARRLGEVQEVSGLVCFLLSPSAAFITGTTMYVDGGQVLFGQPLYKIPDHQNMPAYKWENDVKSKL